ncbi:VPLPA-CTERM sorting domain-containing protein [Methylococcus sp. EFPC2]|uniref:VPLPA-CTERM sorting domain-containing protein n=1 Tax=Methylococcus sp. EFPC2 TaxID=2812648 RepID=UPI0019684AD4|nr:VPLPA-CTERM sorting domain-containing protein [Methylococcus sp. EFPC2]QSA95752.1 VPLPA-CTERM sorting domain-containing protein [Methylococcus sp. EFPC2]
MIADSLRRLSSIASTGKPLPSRTTFTLALALLAGSSPENVLAVTVTEGSGKVSTIFENQPDNSIGRGPAVFIGGDSHGSPRRGLIGFNIAADIPAGAIITSVQLTLYLAQVAGSGTGNEDAFPRTIELHRLTNDWAHGPTALGLTQIDGTDQGFPAIPPSPTWNERRYQQGQPWTTPGGDFVPTASASTAVGDAVNSAYTWGSTPALVADVQSMLDEPTSNHGWLLQNTDEYGLDTYRVFYTKDWSDTAMRPRLQVSYEMAPVPLPAAVWLFGSSLVGLTGLARRKAVRQR